MKRRALIFMLVLTAAAFAAQDEIKFTRAFKAGEKDTYAFKVQTKMAMGDMDMQMRMTQEITKVFENGDAEQKTTISEMKLFMNGTDMSQMVPANATGQPTVVRINKNGMPVEKKPSSQSMMGGMGELMALGNMMADKAFKVGQPVPVDVTDPKDPKSTVKGTMILEAIEEGIARIKGDIKVTNAQNPKPIHILSTSWVEVASSKPNKVEGKVTGVTGPQGMEIESVSFTMERVK